MRGRRGIGIGRLELSEANSDLIRAWPLLSFGVDGSPFVPYIESMNAKVRNLLRGAGSIMDLAPARDLRKMAPKLTGADRMAGHFARAGQSVSRACDQFGNDAKTPPTNKASST